MSSSLQLLVEEKLGYSYHKWYKSALKDKLSYRLMALVLYEETGVMVSKSSLHLWAQKEES